MCVPSLVVIVGIGVLHYYMSGAYGKRAWRRSSSGDPLCVELFHRKNAENDKQRHDSELGNQEGRLFLRWSQRLQGWHLQEGLNHRNEGIQIKGQHGAHHVNQSPSAG